MHDEHLDLYSLLGLLEDRTDPASVGRRAIDHMRSLSEDAERVFERVEALLERRRRAEAVDYTAAFEAAQRRAQELAARLEADRGQARTELRRLLDLRPRRRIAAIESARTRYRSPVLVELLLEEARGTVGRRPREAYELLEAARAVLLYVNARIWGEAFVDRLRVRVLAERANTLRVAGELQAADELWRLVDDHLSREPVGDCDLEAQLLGMEASLRRDQRRFDEAEALLARCRRLYESAGQAVGVAKALLKLGSIRCLRGNPDGALEVLRQAEPAADSASDPRLSLAVQHAIALCFCDLDRPADAALVATAQSRLYARYSEVSVAGPHAWLLGRIARGLKRHDSAEKHFLNARNRYLAEGIGYDAALVSLDLADLYLEDRRTAEVRRLAEAMYSVFRAKDVHREAIAALTLFQRAAAAEQLEPTFLARLRDYLQRARRDPRFRFESEPG